MKVESYDLEMDDLFHPQMVKENEYETSKLSINCPEDIYNFCCNSLRLNRKSEEYVYMICLNTPGKIVGVFPVSHGTLRNALCNPREVMIRALLCGACSFALIHNHPSGETNPSSEDCDLTKRLKEASDIMGISFIDHIIVGKGYYSFCEHRQI